MRIITPFTTSRNGKLELHTLNKSRSFASKEYQEPDGVNVLDVQKSFVDGEYVVTVSDIADLYVLDITTGKDLEWLLDQVNRDEDGHHLGTEYAPTVYPCKYNNGYYTMEF